MSWEGGAPSTGSLGEGGSRWISSVAYVRLSLNGSLSRSPYWRQMKPSILGARRAAVGDRRVCAAGRRYRSASTGRRRNHCGNRHRQRRTTPLSGRKITAVNEATGSRYETSTAGNGEYTLKVPSGTYRLDVELRQGESLEARPDATTSVNVGDVDASRNFVVNVRR